MIMWLSFIRSKIDTENKYRKNNIENKIENNIGKREKICTKT